MFKFKSLLCGVVAVLFVLATSTVVFADETEFDASYFENMFEIEDGEAYNYIGEDGTVQAGGTEIKKGTLSVQLSSEANLMLLENKKIGTLHIYKDSVPVSSVELKLETLDVIEVDGLTTGTYTYVIDTDNKYVVFDSMSGSITIDSNSNLVLPVSPVCILSVVDSGASASGTKFHFANSPNEDFVANKDVAANFAVARKTQYKIRKDGVTNYTTIEIPSMAEVYTYDLGTKISSTDNTNIPSENNPIANEPAKLPDDLTSEDNPFNVPPTDEIDDTNNVKNVAAVEALLFVVFPAVIIGVFVECVWRADEKETQRKNK